MMTKERRAAWRHGDMRLIPHVISATSLWLLAAPALSQTPPPQAALFDVRADPLWSALRKLVQF